MRDLKYLLLFLLVVSTAGCMLKDDGVRPVEDMSTARTNPVSGYYKQLGSCVRDAVRASHEGVASFGIGPMPNNTGRFQFGEKGAGYSLTLQGTFFLSESLEVMGFPRKTRAPVDLQMMKEELSFGKDNLLSDGNIYNVSGKTQRHKPVLSGQLNTYDIGINGQFTSEDMFPGVKAEVDAYGAYAGWRKSGSRIVVDLKIFDAVNSDEYTAQAVDMRVKVVDAQLGVNRFLLSPMTIQIGAELAATRIDMHDIAARIASFLSTYRIVTMLYPTVAAACNQYTAGFMGPDDNPGWEYLEIYGEPLIRKVFRARKQVPVVAQVPEQPKLAAAPVAPKETFPIFIPCGRGDKEFGCKLGTVGNRRIQMVNKCRETGGQVQSIVGFTPGSPQDEAHALTHASDVAKRLAPLQKEVRIVPANAEDSSNLKRELGPDASGVIVELVNTGKCSLGG